MRPRTGAMLGGILAGLGVLLLAAAAVLYWVVVPNQAQLPADTNTTRQYEGTARVLLNPQALASNDTARAIVRDVPVTATRTVKVLATDGDAAQVSDARTLLAGGQPVGQTQATYAVNRKSLENAGSHPADWNVINQQGLTVSWPIGAKQQDYQGWVNETQTSTTLKYVREEQHGGVDTYVYQAQAPAAPIKNPQVLSALPQALPVSALAALSAVLPIPDELKAQLATVLPSLTQPVPLTYTYESSSTYWVDPTTGIVIDTHLEEIRKAGLNLPGGGAATANIPVYDVVTQNTQASISQAAADATHDGNQIRTYGRTLPLIFLALGVVALIGGAIFFLAARRRRSTVDERPAG